MAINEAKMYTVPLYASPSRPTEGMVEKLRKLVGRWRYQVQAAQDSSYKHSYELCADELEALAAKFAAAPSEGDK